MPSPASRFSRQGPRSGGGTDRPLALHAAVAAVVAVLVSLGICMAVALLGWFFADSGAHGNTIDALRAGGVAWVFGLGGAADTSIGHVGLTPLGLTAILVVAVVRSARWGWRRSAVDASVTSRTAASAVGAFVGIFVLFAVVLVQVLPPATLNPSVPGAFGGALLISALGSVWAGLLESGHLGVVWGRVPALVQAIVRIAVRSALTLVAAAAILVAGSLIFSFNDATATYTALKLGFGDALMLTLVCVLSLPNAVGFALAYLAGPGFAVGTGTSVTVSSVSLGALPLFPMVAALPDPGHQSGWLVLLLLFPGLSALLAASRVQRDLVADGWDQVLIRGLGGGALAGLVITVLAVISGGALGNHRMSEIGAAFWPVLVCAVGGMALGGALGALITSVWQRWRAH